MWNKQIYIAAADAEHICIVCIKETIQRKLTHESIALTVAKISKKLVI